MTTDLKLPLQYIAIRDTPLAQKYELHSLNKRFSPVCHLTLKPQYNHFYPPPCQLCPSVQQFGLEQNLPVTGQIENWFVYLWFPQWMIHHEFLAQLSWNLHVPHTRYSISQYITNIFSWKLLGTIISLKSINLLDFNKPKLRAVDLKTYFMFL